MKLFITLLSILLMTSNLKAAHIIGGEISYECLGNNEYRVTIEIYRDCNSSGAQFDNPLLLFVYDGATNQRIPSLDQDIFSPNIVNLPPTFNSNPCLTPPANICVEWGVYESIITLPPNADRYTIAYQRCCRGPDITNLVNPEAQGLTLSAFIPGTNSGISCNSSPKFSNYPPLILCADQELIFDHSAIDVDGDSLVYELCAPYQGGDQNTPLPDPASNPPFDFVVFNGAYSASVPLGAAANMTIDSQTGLLTCTPQFLGSYAVGICVHEYRNGQYISTNRRDFLFKVEPCEVQLAADITDQVDMPGFISVCQGLSFDFINPSYVDPSIQVGPFYHWDFGVPGIDSDTSNLFEPSFTFPDEGVYTVTLIINPGLPCSDTTTEDFIVYKEFNLSISNNGPQCITGNSLDFFATGDFNDSTIIQWNFGPNASILNANDSIVTNVVFDTSGYIPIVFTAEKGVCEATIYDSVFIFQEPSIGFYITDSLLCVPASVNFLDSSFATTPIFYEWDFGNGDFSNEVNPSTIYSDSGVYDVSLTIWTDSGCIDTLSLIKPSFIEIFSSPIAGISSDVSTVNAFNPYVEISEQCINHSSFEIHVDTTISTVSPYLHGFILSGEHNPFVVAFNDEGCTDTAYIQIFVDPEQSIFIPNTFTPNNDGKNDFFFPQVLDVLSYDLKVFNRFGKIIWESSSYGETWDGKFKGNKSPDGVYVYQLKYIDLLKIPHEKYGHLNILR